MTYYQRRRKKTNHNAAIGIVLLAFVGIIILAIAFGGTNFRQELPAYSLPATSYTDAIGNSIKFFGQPEGNYTQQLSSLPFTITTNSEPQQVQANQVANYLPEHSNSTTPVQTTTPTDKITIGIQSIKYQGLTKVVTSSSENGITQVKRGEIASIISQILLVDPIDPYDEINDKPNYVKGPFTYHVLLTCCNGDVSVYSTRPVLTDSNGYFVINYATDLKDILGRYTVTVITEKLDGHDFKFSTEFDLVENNTNSTS